MEALQRREDPIEIVITTHPHADHMGSVEWLLPNFTISRYVDAGKTNTSKLFKRVENALDGSLVPRDRVVDGVPDIDFCPRQDVSARVLRAEGFGSPHDLNDCSVVVRVDYGATSFLFVGDAEAEQEEQLLKEPATRALLDCDFLKVGHHGSDTSSGEEFIGAVSPRVVAISCGEPGVGTNAGYRHPRASTVKRLMRHADARPTAESLPAYDAAAREWVVLEVGSEVYSTSTRRDLVFTSDGARITLRED
jgi:beta-lactamase superfamily II metal-dependent hydrolase